MDRVKTAPPFSPGPNPIIGALLDHINTKLDHGYIARKTAESTRAGNVTSERISIINGDDYQDTPDYHLHIWLDDSNIEIGGRVNGTKTIKPTTIDLNNPNSIDQIDQILKIFYVKEHG